MDQVFIANPKGGCGKTTISTQLAGYYANNKKNVLLIDHDAQKSSSDWLASRPKNCASIRSVAIGVGEDVDLNGLDVAVHDMPAAWTLEHIEDIILPGDKVLIPVLSSPNDIKACLRFVMGLNRSGILESGIQVGLIANRVRPNTRYAKVLEEFLDRLDMPLVTKLRDTQNYIKVMDWGMSIFDLPASRVKLDLEQWRPILRWLKK